jgi:hypothetical protein
MHQMLHGCPKANLYGVVAMVIILWMTTSRCNPCYSLALSSRHSICRLITVNQHLSCKTRRYSNLDDLFDEVLNSSNLPCSTLTSSDVHDSQEHGRPHTTAASTSHHGWKYIDWNEEAHKNKNDAPPPSPVEMAIIRDRLVYLKRDDQVWFVPSVVTNTIFHGHLRVYRTLTHFAYTSL